MKKIFAALALASGLTFSSCDFLDVIPEGSATIDDLYKTHIQANEFAASLYWYMPNRFWFQSTLEMCGGDMVSSFFGSVRYFKWKSLVYDNMETPSNTYVAMWSQSAISYPAGAMTSYRMWEGIRNAHNLIANADRVPDATEAEKSMWKGEAYYIIGYLHHTLLEYYGPTIIVDHELSTNEDLNVPRSTYLQCVQFISDMYDKAAEFLPSVQPSNYYGRATKVLALSMKSRLWTYAASPHINGNSEWYAGFTNPDGTHLIPQEYDKELWKKAMDASEEAIREGEANGYGLYTVHSDATDDFGRGYDNYRATFIGPKGSASFFNNMEHLFSYNNQSNISYNIKSMAPRVGYDSYSTYGYRGYFVPTFEAVECFLSKNGLPMDVDPETKDLNLYSIAPGDSTVLLHRNREPRFYASIGYDRGEYDLNGGTFIIHARRGEPQQNDGNTANEYQSCTGYYVKKWVSSVDAFNTTTREFSNNKYAYPYIRMAEAYLNYAEAEAEYTGSLSAKGLTYLNKIRNRAGIPDFEKSWAVVGGTPTGETLIKAIRQERMSEFIFEGRWFFDLRRWKIAGDYIQKKQRSWNLEGRTESDFYKITEMYEGTQTRTFTTPKNYWLAIPQDQISINSSLVQNPGY